MTVNGNVMTNSTSANANGNLSLVDTFGSSLTINGGDSITANQGNILIQNQNAFGTIVIGDGTHATSVTTNVTGTKTLNGNGLVSIYLGTTAPQQINGHTSGTVNNIAIAQTNSGTAYFGSNPNQIIGGASGSGSIAAVNLIIRTYFSTFQTLSARLS